MPDESPAVASTLLNMKQPEPLATTTTIIPDQQIVNQINKQQAISQMSQQTIIQMNNQQAVSQAINQQQQQQQQQLQQSVNQNNQQQQAINQMNQIHYQQQTINQSNNLMNQANNGQTAAGMQFPSYMQPQPMLHHPMAIYHHSISTPRMQQSASNQQIMQTINPSMNQSTPGPWDLQQQQQQWPTVTSTPMPQMLQTPATPALSSSYTMQSPPLVPLVDLNATAQASDATSDAKRRKVERGARKIACTFCHTAKTVCVGGRPCERCIRLQKAEQCVDRVTTNKRHKREEREQNGSGETARPVDNTLGFNANQPTKQTPSTRPVEDIVANGSSTIALDADTAWTAIPDLIHSSFFQCLLVPQRAYPAVKLEQTIQNVLYVLTYLQDSLSEGQFKRAITEMGYAPINTTNSTSSDPDLPSPLPIQTNAADIVPEGKVLWRSTYSHLPDISMPLQFSFNWNVSPSTALHETTIASIFPTLIIERKTPVLPHIAMLHGAEPGSAESKEAVPSRYRLNELDLPLSVQVNDKFEYVFAWTQSEVKLLFSRHGRRAMEKLSVGNFTPALATLRDLLDGRAEFAHTVMIRNKYGNEIAAVEHKRMVMNDTGWFERIVWTWIPLTP